MTAISFSGADITVDATLVAQGFGMSETKLRDLMRAGTVSSRCETGDGEDAGRTRLSFIYGNRVLRMIADADGNLIEPPSVEFARSTLLSARRGDGDG